MEDEKDELSSLFKNIEEFFNLVNRVRGGDEESFRTVHPGAGIPSHGQSHDAIIVQTGGGGVGEGAIWGDFLFEGEELLFLYLVIEQADVGVLQGGLETEDDVGLGCLGGDEGDDVQTAFQQVVNDRSADAVDFHNYQVEEPIAIDLGDASFQLGVVDAVEAGEVHLLFSVQVQDGDDSVVAGGGNVHGSDVVMVHFWQILREGGDGFDIAEDGTIFLNELG